MKYENSENVDGRIAQGANLADGVEVRTTNKGVFMVAVFDEEEQVSEEVTANMSNEIAFFAEGYSKSKRKYGDG